MHFNSVTMSTQYFKLSKKSEFLFSVKENLNINFKCNFIVNKHQFAYITII